MFICFRLIYGSYRYMYYMQSSSEVLTGPPPPAVALCLAAFQGQGPSGSRKAREAPSSLACLIHSILGVHLRPVASPSLLMGPLSRPMLCPSR